MKKHLPTASLACAMLCAAGCLRTVDTVENANKTYVSNEVLRRHVETDASAYIKVTNLVDSFAPNGFLQIAFELTNTSSSPRAVFFRCEWYDENGMPVETSLTQWKEERLNARDSRVYRFTAPNVRAQDYKLRLSRVLPR